VRANLKGLLKKLHFGEGYAYAFIRKFPPLWETTTYHPWGRVHPEGISLDPEIFGIEGHPEGHLALPRGFSTVPEGSSLHIFSRFSHVGQAGYPTDPSGRYA